MDWAAPPPPHNSHVLAAQDSIPWVIMDSAGPKESNAGAMSYMGFAGALSYMDWATI